jgi:hypothetical protein
LLRIDVLTAGHIRAANPGSEHRASGRVDGLSGDPARVLRGDERDDVGDVSRLTDAAERRHRRRLARDTSLARSQAAFISVSTKPAATALTVICRGASSLANVLVKVSMAAFVME